MNQAAVKDSSDMASLTDAAGKVFEEQIPVTCRKVYQKALSGKASPRSAIKAFCLRCVGYVRADIRECTAFACPLHRYRPFQGKDADEE